MFSRLKLKLTLVNLIVAVLIFAVVFTGVYYTMYRSITDQSEELMGMLTYSLVGGDGLQDPKLLGLLGNHAFIIAEISSEGQLFSYRSTPFMQQLTANQVIELVNSVINSNGISIEKFRSLYNVDPFGNKASVLILQPKPVQTPDGLTYLARLIKKDNDSFSMVFINIDYEKKLLNSLLKNLVMVALAGLILVFAASFFLAGRAVRPVKAAWEKQKNFVADASHELRTPLSVIQTNLELVMENKTETIQSQSKWLENIYLENKHMTKLVNDLLLLARADSDLQLLEMEPFSISTAAEEASSPLMPMAKEKDLNVTVSIQPDIEFFGDQSKIKQLIVILMDNAVKYTSKGGSVGLSVNGNRDNIEIIVSDTGEGIAGEDLDKIFERFYRVDKARHSETGGSGLGLSIACWIIKEHHGVIKVDSTVGKGSTFRISFPRGGKYRK